MTRATCALFVLAACAGADVDTNAASSGTDTAGGGETETGACGGATSAPAHAASTNSAHVARVMAWSPRRARRRRRRSRWSSRPTRASSTACGVARNSPRLSVSMRRSTGCVGGDVARARRDRRPCRRSSARRRTPTRIFQRPIRIACAYSYIDAYDGRAQPRPMPCASGSSGSPCAAGDRRRADRREDRSASGRRPRRPRRRSCPPGNRAGSWTSSGTRTSESRSEPPWPQRPSSNSSSPWSAVTISIV